MKFWNKILFEQNIKKIKSESVRNYFLTLLSVKQIFTKLILFLLVSLIIVTISFTARQFALDHWKDRVSLNTGIAFSGMSNLAPGVVMAIQGIPAFLALIAFIFITNPFIYIPLLFMSIGGMCNFIDRFIYEEGQKAPSVVDYIHMTGSIVNFQDIIVVTSSVIFAINCVIYIILLVIRENKKSKFESIKLNK